MHVSLDTARLDALRPRTSAIQGRPKVPPVVSNPSLTNRLHSPLENLVKSILPEGVINVIEQNPNDIPEILEAFKNLHVDQQRQFLTNLVNAGLNLGINVNELNDKDVSEIFSSKGFDKNFSRAFALAARMAKNDKNFLTNPVESINRLVARNSNQNAFALAA